MKTLLFLTLGGSATALLLLALRGLLGRRLPSTAYYYAWLIVLLRFALPLPGLVPGRSTEPAAPAREAVAVRESAPEGFFPLYAGDYAPRAEAEEAPSLSPAPLPVFEAGLEEPVIVPVQAAQTAKPAPAARTAAIDWKSPALWLSVWALGTLVRLAVPVTAYLRFRAALLPTLREPDDAVLAQYRAIPGRKCELCVSDAVKTPLTLGFFQPRIVLPAGLHEGETLSNVLRHELTHVRRRDTLYKWLALAVFSAHWFNPLTWLLRRELDRACELSCDEALLRGMSREEKRSYGRTLLQMAASGALPAGVVATTFATEKKNLKERLEQIMTYRKSTARLLAALLTILLLAGCARAAGPAPEAEAPADTPTATAAVTETPETPETAKPADEPDDEPKEVHVSNVDELLAAIAPDTVIVLAAGDYNLTTAENYGKTPEGAKYTWEPLGYPEGYGFILMDVKNLTLRGESPETTRILTEPRFVNVLRFIDCEAPTVEGLTVGHTEGGYCMGGVLRFDRCDGATVNNCGLFGCGTIGVWARDCDGLTVVGSRIYECSDAAVNVAGCAKVRVEDCSIYEQGKREDIGSALSLFEATDTDGFVLYNNRIFKNSTQYLVNLTRTRNAFFLTNEVLDNEILTSVFRFEQYPCVVDGCVFENNQFRVWVNDHALEPVSKDGYALDADALEDMTLRDSDPDMAFPTIALGETAAEVEPGASISVSTVDELLKAIGPDRTIVLEGELFDLAEAATYGKAGTEYYRWTESYDGPKLVIHDLSNLAIVAPLGDAPEAVISATPRYADVLSFENCSEITLEGFLAGHTKEPGQCAGGVLYFSDCHGIRIERCRLYGCGILGVQTMNCSDITLTRAEIFECSQGAGQFYNTDGIRFENCRVHDVPSPYFSFSSCGDIEWNGEAVTGRSAFDVDADGQLVLEGQVAVGPYYRSTGLGLEYVTNPFANEPAQTLKADAPMAKFAARVQQEIQEGDWEALADELAYPLQFYIEDYSLVIQSREDFLTVLQDENLLSKTFSEAWRKQIADASLTECGLSAFGNTVLDHQIAIAVTGSSGAGDPKADDFSVTAISFAGPFWPGTAK